MIKNHFLLNFLQERKFFVNIFDFCSGFACGVVTVIYHKNIIEKFIEYFKPKNENKLQIDFICKITNTPLFDELFPKFTNKSAPRTQPYWDFYENTEIIKINIDTPMNFSISFESLLSELDLPLFKSFGKIYVYIHYKNKTIVYLPESIIDLSNFDTKETELSKKYKNVVVAVFKNENSSVYVTSYLKSFLNNTIEITPEILLLNRPHLEATSLQIINNNEICNFNLTDSI